MFQPGLYVFERSFPLDQCCQFCNVLATRGQFSWTLWRKRTHSLLDFQLSLCLQACFDSFGFSDVCCSPYPVACATTVAGCNVNSAMQPSDEHGDKPAPKLRLRRKVKVRMQTFRVVGSTWYQFLVPVLHKSLIMLFRWMETGFRLKHWHLFNVCLKICNPMLLLRSLRCNCLAVSH